MKARTIGVMALAVGLAVSWVKPSLASSGSPGDGSYLSRLEGIHAGEEDDNKKETTLRLRSIRESAFALGARAGLAWETERIDRSLMRVGGIMDKIFDFRAVSLNDGRVTPPVVLASRDATVLDGETVLRRVNVSWHMLHPATLATVLPNWRMYLIRHYPSPDTRKTPKILLPKSKEESVVWKRGIDEGFAKGVEQSKTIFRIGLRRLRMDYVGMVRFHALAVENIVSIPVYAHTDLGVVRNGDRLDAGVRIYRISVPSTFTVETGWKDPAILSDRKNGETP